MKAFLATLMIGAAVGPTAIAQSYGQYNAPSPDALMPRSSLAGHCVPVPPYGLMPVRIYTTPQAGPYYNVPPYPVIAPY